MIAFKVGFQRIRAKLFSALNTFTYITLILTSPISYPVSKILNLVLKKERPTLFTRSELHTLIKMHGPLASPEDYDSPSTDISLPLSSSPTPPSSLILSTELDNAHFDASLVGLVQKNTKVSVLRRNGCSSLVEKDKTTSVKSELSEDEVRMISNILGLRDQTCNEIMSPLDNLFVLHTTDIIDKEFLSKITNCELSYVPVCINNDRSKMRGVINVHKVLACNALTNGSSLGDLIGRENPPWFQPLIYVSEKMSILTLLGIFRDAPQNRIVAVTNEVAFDSTSTIKCKIRGFGGPNDSHLAFYFEQRRQIQGLLKYGSNQTTQPSDFLSPANVQLIRATGIVTWKSLMDHLIKAPK
uniref:Protein MAM3 n=1 Tax=Schistocephalus solidus TaxID=70667 RepID=A0A0X3P9G1_SCHSO